VCEDRCTAMFLSTASDVPFTSVVIRPGTIQ
jgi:hypothetical protein